MKKKKQMIQMIFLVVHGFLMFLRGFFQRRSLSIGVGLEHGASLALGIIITHSPHLEIVLLNDLQSTFGGLFLCKLNQVYVFHS